MEANLVNVSDLKSSSIFRGFTRQLVLSYDKVGHMTSSSAPSFQLPSMFVF